MLEFVLALFALVADSFFESAWLCLDAFILFFAAYIDALKLFFGIYVDAFRLFFGLCMLILAADRFLLARARLCFASFFFLRSRSRDTVTITMNIASQMDTQTTRITTKPGPFEFAPWFRSSP